METKTLFPSLHNYSCYDVLPVSFKVIVFDTTLLVKKALAALLQHGVQSAIVFDTSQQKFIGMLTVTDFIQLIAYYYNQKSSIDEALEEMEGMQICNLRDLEQNVIACLRKDTITLHPDASLYDASKLLIEHNLHRIPLIEKREDHDILVSVLTQNKVLRFVAANDKQLADKTIADLKIGTFSNLTTARLETPLIDILNIFIKQKISAVPIVDAQGVVLNVYEKYDALLLAKEGPYYDLTQTVKKALGKRPAGFSGFHTCTLQDKFGQILDTIQNVPVRRFIIVENSKLYGIISLSDILEFMIK